MGGELSSLLYGGARPQESKEDNQVPIDDDGVEIIQQDRASTTIIPWEAIDCCDKTTDVSGC